MTLAPQPIASCPFCTLPLERIWLRNAHAIAFRDDDPIREGHTFVIPRRHVSSIFDAPVEELEALWSLVAEVRTCLQAELEPDGYNIGLNDGAAAGQILFHGHIH